MFQNRGKSPSVIQKALWNLLKKKENCPFSTQSWCYFEKVLAQNAENTTLIIPPLLKPYLNHSEYVRAQEVFDSFASLNMCGALTMGQTQNANESLHSIILHNSPKNKHVGQKSIKASTALTVCNFNDGELTLASMLDAVYCSIIQHTSISFQKRSHAQDQSRVCISRNIKEMPT